ncbi:hypothetical protein K9F62_11250 [Desulfovibrio sp. JY]|nr:hypothetical protein K9F62_11250 [Desulfovibrio sp. JY]
MDINEQKATHKTGMIYLDHFVMAFFNFYRDAIYNFTDQVAHEAGVQPSFVGEKYSYDERLLFPADELASRFQKFITTQYDNGSGISYSILDMLE